MLPFRSIKVGAHKYKIVIDMEQLHVIEEESGDDLYGAMQSEDQTIFLRPGLPAEQLRETLIHEINHIIFNRYVGGLGLGPGNVEEVICGQFAFGWVSVLDANPRFARWLGE